jgi:hypothetical protein
MTGLFDDDDLFAPRPVDKPARKSRPVAEPVAQPIATRPPQIIPQIIPPAVKPSNELPATHKSVDPLNRHPVASFACLCGARDEVKEPAPVALDCWQCHAMEGLRRIAPRFLPPAGGGRVLTAPERRGMKLDSLSTR